MSDVAGIYGGGRAVWMVRHYAPRRSAPLTRVSASRVATDEAAGWAACLGQTLEVKSGYEFLARYPERNPRYARYDAAVIAFRKRPLRRLVAAVFSKAFAAAALTAGGALTFALVRHVYVPVHFAPTTNTRGIMLSVIALALLYAAGPQDIAFNLVDGTYTLSSGLLYFSSTRAGRTADDLECVGVISTGTAWNGQTLLGSRQSSLTHTMVLCWRGRRIRTPIGAFSTKGEATAHAERLAADLSAACGMAIPFRPNVAHGL